MRQARVKRARRHRGGGLTFLTVVSLGGVALLLAGWNAHVPHHSDLSPAEVVAFRFPDPRNDELDNIADARAQAATADDIGGARAQAANANDGDVADARAQVLPADDLDAQYSLFSPYPTMSPPSPAPATYETASLGSTPVDLPPQQSAPATDIRATALPAAETRTEAKRERKAEPKPEPKTAAVHHKPAPHSVRRPGAVLSDAQIASIKTRLHLTQDQQEMWPAVEAALRSLSYAKKPGVRGGAASARVADIDPDSEAVQRLKSAAFPLIMSFSDEQKQELRVIVHVAGLEKLASQF